MTRSHIPAAAAAADADQIRRSRVRGCNVDRDQRNERPRATSAENTHRSKTT